MRLASGTTRSSISSSPAGFAQVGVQVDEAGQQDQPVGVEPLCPGARVGCGVRTDRGDEAVADEHVGGSSAEDVGTDDQQVTHAATPSPASRW